jgi:hypothetical protein
LAAPFDGLRAIGTWFDELTTGAGRKEGIHHEDHEGHEGFGRFNFELRAPFDFAQGMLRVRQRTDQPRADPSWWKKKFDIIIGALSNGEKRT